MRRALTFALGGLFAVLAACSSLPGPIDTAECKWCPPIPVSADIVTLRCDEGCFAARVGESTVYQCRSGEWVPVGEFPSPDR